jgi:four helix bundle protein
MHTPRQINSHKDLIVWQRSMQLVDRIYDIARELPARENFGLFSQLTRAAVSVPANIAEGRARSTAKDFAHFLVLARSSLMELDTLLEIAVRRHYIGPEVASPACGEIQELSKMLSTLRKRINPPGRALHTATT